MLLCSYSFSMSCRSTAIWAKSSTSTVVCGVDELPAQVHGGSVGLDSLCLSNDNPSIGRNIERSICKVKMLGKTLGTGGYQPKALRCLSKIKYGAYCNLDRVMAELLKVLVTTILGTCAYFYKPWEQSEVLNAALLMALSSPHVTSVLVYQIRFKQVRFSSE
ncbi:hypothetical protein L3X38_041494 [Prunus dulcis]|uniref:Uncharacterized protein n=1 Tax=Prunus dulcis TaxID=3755 RepID=A0AAD4YKA8_PRUDU|nr:hypothetical protein L3X38_041494 [Prunus dulcis]